MGILLPHKPSIVKENHQIMWPVSFSLSSLCLCPLATCWPPSSSLSVVNTLAGSINTVVQLVLQQPSLRGQPPLPSSNRPLASKASEESLHALGQTPSLSWDTVAAQTAVHSNTDCASHEHPTARPFTWSTSLPQEYLTVDAKPKDLYPTTEFRVLV